MESNEEKVIKIKELNQRRKHLQNFMNHMNEIGLVKEAEEMKIKIADVDKQAEELQKHIQQSLHQHNKKSNINSNNNTALTGNKPNENNNKINNKKKYDDINDKLLTSLDKNNERMSQYQELLINIVENQKDEIRTKDLEKLIKKSMKKYSTKRKRKKRRKYNKQEDSSSSSSNSESNSSKSYEEENQMLQLKHYQHHK